MADLAVPMYARYTVLLDDLFERWCDVPRVVREIDSWKQADQLDYTEEWPLHFDKLARLRLAATAGQLSPDQRRQYDELECLVRQHEPALRAILR